MVCPPRAAVLGRRTRVDAYNRTNTKPLTGEPDAGDPPVRFGGRGKVQSLVPTPIGICETASSHGLGPPGLRVPTSAVAPKLESRDSRATSDRKSTRLNSSHL